MSSPQSRLERERQKLIQEKCQTLLAQMLRDEDNKYCVDCDAKGPRWASWNLGVFLCIRCAGIHRNLGVHISRVKSVNLDSWSPDQVACLQGMGNSRARAVYEATLPDSFRRPHTDSSLEAFVRAKYEQKKYLAKEWVPSPPPKLCWDQEIEEALRKKEGGGKKKASVSSVSSSGSSTGEVPVPLPKPKSGGGLGTPPARVRKETPPAAATPKQDLLSLDATTTPPPSAAAVTATVNNIDALTGDDPFGAFVGSDSPQSSSEATPPTSAPKKSSEEEDFFNQSCGRVGSADPSSSQKLTKDSILALYNQGQPQIPVQIPGQPQMQAQAFYGGVGGIALNPYQAAYYGQVPMMQPSMMHLQQGMATLSLGSQPQPSSLDLSVGQGQFLGGPSSLPTGSLVGMAPQMQQAYTQPNGHTLSTNLWQ